MGPREDADILTRKDPVIEAYKKDVDRTLLRESLKMTFEERLKKLQAMAEFFEGIRGAARRGGD